MIVPGSMTLDTRTSLTLGYPDIAHPGYTRHVRQQGQSGREHVRQQSQCGRGAHYGDLNCFKRPFYETRADYRTEN